MCTANTLCRKNDSLLSLCDAVSHEALSKFWLTCVSHQGATVSQTRSAMWGGGNGKRRRRQKQRGKNATKSTRERNRSNVQRERERERAKQKRTDFNSAVLHT